MERFLPNNEFIRVLYTKRLYGIDDAEFVGVCIFRQPNYDCDM